MWEPRRLITLWTSTACYRDSFNFTLITLQDSTAYSIHCHNLLYLPQHTTGSSIVKFYIPTGWLSSKPVDLYSEITRFKSRWRFYQIRLLLFPFKVFEFVFCLSTKHLTDNVVEFLPPSQTLTKLIGSF
jgi:hypothetical protein